MEDRGADIKTRRHIGSADAERIARIGRIGLLNDSDRQRVAILLGLEAQRQFTSRAMQTGIDLENRIFEIVRNLFPTAESNIYYRSEALSKRFGFEIGTHPDYEIIEGDTLIWIENKATQGTMADALSEYSDQLLWHEMLGVEKARDAGLGRFLLCLTHYHVEDHDAPFTADNFSITEVSSVETDSAKMRKYAPYRKGLKVIAAEIENGFEWQPREELYADNLPAPVSEEMREIAVALKEVERLETRIEDFKRNILELMQSENIRSIRNEYFVLTVVSGGQTTRFDSRAFGTDHPELAAQYTKVSERKPYLLIKTN
jgi:hypothetical protein